MARGVSVIVPTFNEEKYIPLLLASLKRQTVRPSEVIVADGGSTDHTCEIAVREGAFVLRMEGTPEFPSINRAAEVAEYDLLIFTGADAIFPRDAIERTLDTMSRRSLQAAYCPVYPYDAPAWGRVEFRLWYTATYIWFLVTKEANACTAYFAIKRDVFRATGGFLDVYGGDSVYSRLLAKKVRIAPIQSLKIPISGRKLSRMGPTSFNGHQITVLLDVFFWFMRSSAYLEELKRRLHSDSYQTLR